MLLPILLQAHLEQRFGDLSLHLGVEFDLLELLACARVRFHELGGIGFQKQPHQNGALSEQDACNGLVLAVEDAHLGAVDTCEALLKLRVSPREFPDEVFQVEIDGAWVDECVVVYVLKGQRHERASLAGKRVVKYFRNPFRPVDFIFDVTLVIGV